MILELIWKTFDLNGAKLFVEAAEMAILNAGLPCDPLSMDHICYRVSSVAQYHQICEAIEAQSVPGLGGTLIAEAQVRGRPISTFRLSQHLCAGQQKIELIEIPAPKGDQLPGFEHVEVVTSVPFEAIRNLNPRLVFTDTIQEKPRFPELIWEWSRHTHDDVMHGRVKFHHHSLEAIIQADVHD